MVDFTLTDEQKDIRQLAHDFAEKEIRPVAWELDKDSTFPTEIVQQAWELGLMNNHIPEEYGGPGLDYLTGCLIEEELGWGCRHRHFADVQTAWPPHGDPRRSEDARRSSSAGSPRSQARTFCLTEPTPARTSRKRDAARPQRRQVRDQRDQVLHHQRSHAEWYTVYAKTDKEAGHRGIPLRGPA